MKQNDAQQKVVELPSDPDHRDLWFELRLIKENHLRHLDQDIKEVKKDLKESRQEVNHRIDKLDNRIWWLVGLVTVTMLGVIAQVVVG